MTTENFRDKVTVIGMPSDVNSSFLRGPAAAPAAIRRALYSGASNLSAESGVTLDDPNWWHDLGDIDCTDDTDDDFAALERAVDQVLASGGRPLVLGGDHAITFPVVRAVARVHGDLEILHFDAHPDLYDSYDDNPHSHASPFARIMENQLASRLVQVGIRTLNDHQRVQAQRFAVEIHEMRRWTRDTDLALKGPLYISIDLDCLDPAHAPGVSHLEPGGLMTRDVIDVIQRIEVDVVGVDIVELNPKRDINDMTATVAAKLLRETAAKLAERR